MKRYQILSRMNAPSDLKQLNIRQLELLCAEIRDFLIRSVSKTGGHLASNLGVVELTVALHKVFHSPFDPIFWDVGHQSYTHKLLTGRKEGFARLRMEGGLSGYPKPNESVHDCFVAGHSSTSISAALGAACANRIKGDPHTAVAVIGDGSLTGGEAYEALNNAGKSGTRLIVVLNHNEMSISPNVGAFAGYLSKLRSGRVYNEIKQDVTDKLRSGRKLSHMTANFLSRAKNSVKSFIYPDTFFEDMGFTYLGPIDGHNLPLLIDVLKQARELNRPVVVHIGTKKGKGYAPAEYDPHLYHGVSEFNHWQGDCNADEDNFSFEMGRTLTALAERRKNIVAITAAMTDGTGLTPFAKKYPHRFFDVGIAEAHAVTFAGGFTSRGLMPVFAVYSSFLQRGYDQLLNDCARNHCHMVLCIDRAGFVGADGETHQGLYDVSLLSTIPDVIQLAPLNYVELQTYLTAAVSILPGVVTVRYPRGKQPVLPQLAAPKADTFTHVYYAGETKKKTLLCTYGRVFANCLSADADLLRLKQIHPIPEEALHLMAEYEQVYFVEEGILSGGIAMQCAAWLTERDYRGKYRMRAVQDGYVPQGTVEEQMRRNGMCADQIKEWVDQA